MCIVKRTILVAGAVRVAFRRLPRLNAEERTRLQRRIYREIERRMALKGA
jgi:hypothetical protein